MLKKLSLILVLALALMFSFSGVAYANFGPHGGYVDDTDACAGCHRAHTSFSEVTWVSENPLVTAPRSALLIGSATDMQEFCNACHGDDAPGASTNVVAGVFDSGPSGATDAPEGSTVDGVAITYETSSTFGATLNGGGFSYLGAVAPVSSLHDMEMDTSTDPMWGFGDSVPDSENLTCTSCHDPHGSSNYRLLKDNLNGNTVGGYIDDNPQPFVISAEVGYPIEGWFKHEDGALQMESYRPDYTTPQYRIKDAGLTKNISGWCAGCHERYIVRNDDTAVGGPGDYDYESSFTATSGGGQLPAQSFHRHPVNVSLMAGRDLLPNELVLGNAVSIDASLPLEFASESAHTLDEFRAGNWAYEDYLGCLTCHRAHGTAATMEGWASASLDSTNGTDWYPVMDSDGGVDPNNTSALLRTDNRGVCERCHNK